MTSIRLEPSVLSSHVLVIIAVLICELCLFHETITVLMDETVSVMLPIVSLIHRLRVLNAV